MSLVTLVVMPGWPARACPPRGSGRQDDLRRARALGAPGRAVDPPERQPLGAGRDPVVHDVEARRRAVGGAHEGQRHVPRRAAQPRPAAGPLPAHRAAPVRLPLAGTVCQRAGRKTCSVALGTRRSSETGEAAAARRRRPPPRPGLTRSAPAGRSKRCAARHRPGLLASHPAALVASNEPGPAPRDRRRARPEPRRERERRDGTGDGEEEEKASNRHSPPRSMARRWIGSAHGARSRRGARARGGRGARPARRPGRARARDAGEDARGGDRARAAAPRRRGAPARRP